MKNLCFIDIETTGSIFGFHEIIEIAAIKTSYDGIEILGKRSMLLRPNYPERITKTAQEINEFDIKEWSKAEFPDREIWNEFIEFWNNCVPVCHNPSFERAFITLAIRDCGVDDTGLGYHWIGTESLAWPLHLKGSLTKITLSSLLLYFGFNTETVPHTAMNGASACRDVYLEIIKRYKKFNIEME